MRNYISGAEGGKLYFYVSWKDNFVLHTFSTLVENNSQTSAVTFFFTIGKILFVTFDNLYAFISLKYS